MGSSGGSLGACTCSVGVLWLMLRSIFGSVMTGSSSVSYVALNLWGGGGVVGPDFSCYHEYPYPIL